MRQQGVYNSPVMPSRCPDACMYNNPCSMFPHLPKLDRTSPPCRNPSKRPCIILAALNKRSKGSENIFKSPGTPNSMEMASQEKVPTQQPRSSTQSTEDRSMSGTSYQSNDSRSKTKKRKPPPVCCTASKKAKNRNNQAQQADGFPCTCANCNGSLNVGSEELCAIKEEMEDPCSAEDNAEFNDDDHCNELFDILRETMEDAVKKSLEEVFGRYFTCCMAKIDSLAVLIERNECLLSRIYADLNDKISYYGERNAQQFQYLCGRMEHDKMFYQQQQEFFLKRSSGRQSDQFDEEENEEEPPAEEVEEEPPQEKVQPKPQPPPQPAKPTKQKAEEPPKKFTRKITAVCSAEDPLDESQDGVYNGNIKRSRWCCTIDQATEPSPVNEQLDESKEFQPKLSQDSTQPQNPEPPALPKKSKK